MFRRRKDANRTGGAAGANPYEGLRKQALGAAPTQPSAPGHPDVLGVVFDVPRSGEHLTFIAMADGAASMYTSTGGGTIGAGEHAPGRAAVEALLTQVQADLELFPPDEGTDLPTPDLVGVTVLTPTGRRRAHIPERAFWGQEPSTVVPLIGAMQGLVTAIREASPD